MKSYPRFVIRTVRNGQIRFDHQLWIPQEATDRLNGMRFVFGVYVEGSYTNPVKRLDLLCLWGSEAAYKAIDMEEYNREYDNEKQTLAPDGFLRQYWWHPK